MKTPVLWSLGPMVLEETAAFTESMKQWIAEFQHAAGTDDPRPRLRLVDQTYGDDPGRQQREVSDIDVRVSEGEISVTANGVFEARVNVARLEMRIHIEEFAKTPLISLINPLRGVVTALLPLRFDGLMFHASSAVKDGRGLLFAGVSGQGKTTLSTSLTVAKYISDDISLVGRLGTDFPQVLPSPFFGSAGKLGHELGGAFAALALLEQSTDGQTRVARVPRVEAVGQVMRHVVNFSTDAVVHKALLDRVMDLVERVPVVRLERALETPADEVFDLVMDHVSAGDG